MTDDHPILDQLRELLGTGAVLTGPDAATLLVDHRGIFESRSLGVVRPATTDEVAATVATCAAHDVAVVPQGGNSGLSGGAADTSAARPSLVLSLQRMTAIEEVNAAGWSITAQAGATIQAIQEAATRADRLFAPDWGARGSATIGGAVATDAGGINVLRYGNTRDNVLGIEAVLPDGRVWDGTRALRKDSSGYDLKQLFIGSEGTLGIVTRVTVKLHPATPYVQSAFVALADGDHLLDLFELATAGAPGIVTAFELVPEVALARVCDLYDIRRPLDTRAEQYALLKLASSHPVLDIFSELLAAAAEAGLITDAVVAGTPEQEERLWMIRDELPAYALFADTAAAGLKMDIAVPIDRIAEHQRGVAAIASDIAPNALAYGFGHVGDGNIHTMVMPYTVDDIPAFLEVKPALTERIDALTFSLGGTLSAEHGIGRDLNQRVAAQKSDIEWELMATVKAALDPQDLMNPGAIFPPAPSP